MASTSQLASILTCLVLALVALASSTPISESSYAECQSKTAFCFGFPKDCVASSNCQILFKATQASKKFHLELSSGTIEPDNWIAVGFTNQTKMSGFVVECYYLSKLSKSKIDYSFNTYTEKRHNEVIDQTKVTGISGQSSTFANAKLTCNWNNDAGLVKYSDYSFDFINNKYFVQLATGKMELQKDGTYKMGYHSHSKISTTSAVNLADTKTKPEAQFTTDPLFIGMSSESAVSDSYVECHNQNNSQYFCFGLPENCIDKSACDVLFRSKLNSDNLIQMQLISGKIQQDQYIAVGFTNQSDMSGLVVECYYPLNSNNAIIDYSFNLYNGEHDNSEITNQSTVIGFQNHQTTYQNGVLNCEWEVEQSGIVKYEDLVLDFLDSKFFVQLAKGDMQKSDNGYILTHHDDRLSSDSAQTLFKNGSIQPSSVYEECTKHELLCFGYPADCIDSSSCTILFRSKLVQEEYHLQLISSSTIQPDQYIAVGFSTKSIMSGLVVECYYASKLSKVLIDYSFNSFDKRHNSAIENQTEVVGFDSLIGTYQDGTLDCQWKVNQSTIVNYSNVQSYDFAKNKYFIQLAKGAVTVDKNGEYQNSYHNNDRLSSGSAVSLSSTSSVKSAGTSMMIRWHASLMIFAWVCCVTSGIIMARFARDHYPKRTLFGLKIWFVVHRSLMAIAWLAMVASYIIIFIYTNGWNKTNVHSVGGLVAGILATLQILNSFARPSPSSKNRWIFDYGHWLMGNLAHILAITNIVMTSMERTSSLFWLVISYLFIYLIFSDLLKKLEQKQGFQIGQNVVILAVLTIIGMGSGMIGLIFQYG